MAENTAKIKYLEDEEGVVWLPVTHERAVLDNEGTTLETKLGQKQDTLVSGESIKTINNESILGSGNITVQTSITTDATPTSGSTNPVQSGGVFAALSGKQNTLVSGTNIKTINNQSIVGSGNVTIESGFDIDEVDVSVDNNTGTPSAEGSVSGSTLLLSFHNLKGTQGNTGSSVAYPYELVNNLTTADPTKGLSANMGKELDERLAKLELVVKGNITNLVNALANMAFTGLRPAMQWGQLDGKLITNFSDPTGVSLVDNSVFNMVSLGYLYEGILSPKEGYVLSNISATMTGGGTITFDSQTGAITTDMVTGDITIAATATFDFTTVGYSDDLVFALDGIHKGNTANAWTDLIGGEVFANHGAIANPNHWLFDGSDDYLGGWDETELDFDPASCTIEVAFRSLSSQAAHICHFAAQTTDVINCIYCDMISGYANGCYVDSTNKNVWSANAFNQNSLVALSGANAIQNGVSKASFGSNHWSGNRQGRYIGTYTDYTKDTATFNKGFFAGEIYAIRIYDRQLSQSEILADQALDNTRFNLGLSL